MTTLRRLGNTCGAIGVASALVISCGAAFHARVDDAEGGASSVDGGRGGEASGGAPAALGGSGELAGPGGELAGSGAGAGSGGAAEPACSLLGGVERADGHCYVDVTVGTANQPAAQAACAELALGRSAYLVVLNTQEEQDFILETFMLPFQNISDAWLGLTCSAQTHPEIADCHCQSCSVEDLEQKQAAWTWVDGSRESFGWVNGNPNAPVRCAALGYNPSTDVEAWGWVDRACNLDQVTPVPDNPHTYRTICELE